MLLCQFRTKSRCRLQSRRAGATRAVYRSVNNTHWIGGAGCTRPRVINCYLIGRFCFDVTWSRCYPHFFVIAYDELEIFGFEKDVGYILSLHVRLNAIFTDVEKTVSYSTCSQRFFGAQIQFTQAIQSASFVDLGKPSF